MVLKIKRLAPPPPREEFKAILESGGIKAIREKYDVGEWITARWLQELGLVNPRSKNNLPIPPKQELQHFLGTKTVVAIAEHYDVTISVIYRWLKNYGIYEERPKDTISLSEAARELNITKVAVYLWCKKGLIDGIIRTRHRVFFPRKHLDLLRKAVTAGILGGYRTHKGGRRQPMPKSFKELEHRVKQWTN